MLPKIVNANVLFRADRWYVPHIVYFAVP